MSSQRFLLGRTLRIYVSFSQVFDIPLPKSPFPPASDRLESSFLPLTQVLFRLANPPFFFPVLLRSGPLLGFSPLFSQGSLSDIFLTLSGSLFSAVD